VQTHHENCEGVNESGRGVWLERLTEQGTIRKGELKVLGDQHCLKTFPVFVFTSGDDADRFNGGNIGALQLPKQLVFGEGHGFTDLLDGEYLT
jgi:hypothetical protein